MKFILVPSLRAPAKDWWEMAKQSEMASINVLSSLVLAMTVAINFVLNQLGNIQ